ncbi:hypothetical protein [Streptomyces canus]|uniref:hypothetical protein n=1 Tax=Streptomyces canus TaxID=58343 RepID=UPI0033B7DBA0
MQAWCGRSYLDEKFAARPDLVRYALHEFGHYILERITEAGAERGFLRQSVETSGTLRPTPNRGTAL